MGIHKLVFLNLVVVALGCVALAILALARSSAKCPHCHSTKVRYSQSILVEKFLSLIYLRPYRCRACRRRFYARKQWGVVTSVHENAPAIDRRAKAAGGSNS
jgi:uncharacterized protein with PIN domain